MDSQDRDRELAYVLAALRDGEDAVVVTDAAGRITYVNTAFERMCGHTFRELRGRKPGAVLQGSGTDPATVARMGAAIAVGRGVTEEVLNYAADGRPYWVSMRITPVHDEAGRVERFVAVERETTVAKAAEASLRESEERFRTLSAASPLGVFEANAVGDITYVNPRLEQMWEVPAEELRGDRWLAHVEPEDRPAVQASWAETYAGRGDLEHEYRIRLPGGAVRWMRCRAALRRDGDVVRGAIGTIEDVTDRRQLEAQLRQAQKMEAIGRLAGGMAHDFNNLLAVIQSHTAMLLEDAAPDAAARPDLTAVADAAERAAGLTRQLLAFSRRRLLRPTVLDVDTVVGQLMPMLRRMIGEDIEVTTRLEARAHVMADVTQLEQTVINLAINARDAMPLGGVFVVTTQDVTVDPMRARVLASDDTEVPAGRYVLLSVADSGSGIAPDVLPRIFEPFFTTKAPGCGTGLGLATVYGTVTQSGGYVAVASAVGRGTRFDVYLPWTDAPVDPPAPPTPVSPRGAGVVLVVEDSEMVRRAARRVLERAGYRVVEATSGVEAIRLLEAGDERPDLVLTDVVMPGMGGVALVERLRERYAGLRVLLMSGYPEDAVGRGGVAGASLLEKPFTPAALERAVAEAMGRG